MWALWWLAQVCSVLLWSVLLWLATLLEQQFPLLEMKSSGGLSDTQRQ
jgi:hypothetical protein